MPSGPENGAAGRSPVATIEKPVPNALKPATPEKPAGAPTLTQVLKGTENLPILGEAEIARVFGGDADRVRPQDVARTQILDQVAPAEPATKYWKPKSIRPETVVSEEPVDSSPKYWSPKAISSSPDEAIDIKSSYWKPRSRPKSKQTTTSDSSSADSARDDASLNADTGGTGSEGGGGGGGHDRGGGRGGDSGGDKPPEEGGEEEAEEINNRIRALVNDPSFAGPLRERSGRGSPEEKLESVNRFRDPITRQAAAEILGVEIPPIETSGSLTVGMLEGDTSEATRRVFVPIGRRLTPAEEIEGLRLSEDDDFIDEIRGRYGELTQEQQAEAIKDFPEVRRVAAAEVLGLDTIQTGDTEEPPAANIADGGTGGRGSGNGEPPPSPPNQEHEDSPEGTEEDRNSIEYLASPERGKEIAKGIRKWEALRASGGYENVDFAELNRFYHEERVHTAAQRIVGLRVKIYEPEELEEQAPLAPLPLIEIDKLPDAENPNYISPELWLERYQSRAGISREDAPRFIQEMSAYFEEAKRVGLLSGLNSALEAAFRREVLGGMREGFTSKEIMEGDERRRIGGVDQGVAGVLRSLNATFRSRRMADPNMQRLLDVGELYARLAQDRFTNFIDAKNPEALDIFEQIDHEFKPGQHEDDRESRETYWRPSQGGYYIEIYAQTEEEFMIAAETYLQRQEKITAAPDKIFQKADQFVDIMMNSEGANKVPESFLIKLTDQIYARMGVFGADHANELYHGDQYKQYMDFINKDGKGPDRWLELLKLYDGEVAAVLWMFDNDPRWEAMFSLYGSRGQLARSAQSQRGRGTGLFYQMEELLVEEMVGVRIKNKRNVDNVAGFLSDKKFISMYDGIYKYDPSRTTYGDANTKAYHQQVERQRNMSDEEKKAADRLLTADQKRSIRLGKIQEELHDIEHSIGSGAKRVVTEKGKKPREYDPMTDKPYMLLKNEADRRIYKEALDRAEKAVEVALEIYGAMGEKSKRGGGSFLVNKNSYVDTYNRLKLVNDSRLTPQERDHKKIGRILTDLRFRGKEVKDLSREDRRVYEQYSESGNKGDYRDFVAINLSEKLVQFAETMTKIKYANARAEDRTSRVKQARVFAINQFKRYGFESELYDYTLLSGGRIVDPDELFDKNGNLVAITFDRQGKPEGVQFDGNGAVVFNSRGQRVRIDNLNQNTVASRMKLKRPEEDPNAEDELKRDGQGKVKVEEVPVTFHIATHHPYSDWTSHTYWGYQEEDRGMVLDPITLFAQARKLRAGEIRPKDADPWAVQLLIMDPTLSRIAKFPSSFEDRERKLTMQAVEDSYQSHMRLSKELHMAFFPKGGLPTKDIGMYYGLQDFGGFRKMIEFPRARAAEDPERFARRGRRLIPDIHIPAAALSEIWGQGSTGVLGAFKMFSAPVYRMAGVFALDKFAAQSDVASKMYSALFEGTDREGGYEEGLLLKLTNNSDKLAAVIGKIPRPNAEGKIVWTNPAEQNEFCYALIESLGRLKRYLALFTVMETKIRNASGAFWLENVDILTNNGQVNPEIEAMIRNLPDVAKKSMNAKEFKTLMADAERIEDMTEDEFNKWYNTAIDEYGSPDTGTSRHSAKIFHQRFGELLIDASRMGGRQLYPGEIQPYARIFDPIIIPGATPGTHKLGGGTIWDFIFSKFVPT